MTEQMGIYGRSGIRHSDKATLLTVQCKSGDSDCRFPDCSCPKRAIAEDRKDLITGKRVRHFIFGEGVIQSAKPSHGVFGAGGIAVEVLFDNGKQGSFEATELPLEKFDVIEDK